MNARQKLKVVDRPHRIESSAEPEDAVELVYPEIVELELHMDGPQILEPDQIEPEIEKT